MLKGVVMHNEPPMPNFSPSRRMDRIGWKLIEGFDEPDPEQFSQATFEIVPVLKLEESSISSVEMRKRALEEGANFGQLFGEWLLGHPEKIPRDEQGLSYSIVLPRTVWSNDDGVLYIFKIEVGRYGETWNMHFEFSEVSIYAGDMDMFIRPCEKST
jgi:hypothetical protein